MVDAEWDPRKAAANVKKHGVDFADAATALYDERAITIRDDDEEENATSRLASMLWSVCSWSCIRGAAIGPG
jgi:uncharacterized DUF497 family protein